MRWYCGHCGMLNSALDAYCCQCQRMKDDLAQIEYRGRPSTTTLHDLDGAHKIHFNNLDDDGQEHIHAPQSNCHETDGANEAIEASFEAGDDGRRRYYWFCCNCGDGPLGVGTIPACPSCDQNHIQCTSCDVVLMKMNPPVTSMTAMSIRPQVISLN